VGFFGGGFDVRHPLRAIGELLAKPLLRALAALALPPPASGLVTC
jgi:hypothetical protein